MISEIKTQVIYNLSSGNCNAKKVSNEKYSLKQALKDKEILCPLCCKKHKIISCSVRKLSRDKTIIGGKISAKVSVLNEKTTEIK